MNRPCAAPPIIAAVGLRFELFYALYRSFDANRPDWLPAPSSRVADGFHDLGAWPFAWTGIADTVAGVDAETSYEELDAALGALGPEAFAGRWLTSHLHDSAAAATLVAGERRLGETIARLPARKREWLAHIGLYPLRPEAPGPRLLQKLLDDPLAVRNGVRAILADYWDDCFSALWRALRPAAEARRTRMEDLLARETPTSVFEKLGLRAEYGLEARELRALRGGYRIGFDDVQAIYLLPSAVNEGRFWTVESDREPGANIVWFPCYDAGIGPEIGPRAIGTVPEPDLDLVFRALGDATRWAMLDLLAERPMTPSALADALGVARSTISHHLFLLREADLIVPTGGGRAPIELKRHTFARLSARSLERLFSKKPTAP